MTQLVPPLLQLPGIEEFVWLADVASNSYEPAICRRYRRQFLQLTYLCIDAAKRAFCLCMAILSSG